MKFRLRMAAALALGFSGLLPVGAMAQSRPAGDLPGPIDNPRDLQDTLKMLFKMADTDNNGQISQKEATDVGNLLVGGFFFRADQNGDGVLEPQEAQAAREQLFRQQPLTRYLFERTKPQQGEIGHPSSSPAGNDNPAGRLAQNIASNPIQAIGNMLDSNKNQKIEATELRQAVQQAVQMLFQVADTNNDGQISPVELNTAALEMARTATQVAFTTADADRNGAISMTEFDKALTGPAHAAFRVLDANNDQQLSLQELQRAQQILFDQYRRLMMPDAPNAPIRQIQNATAPTTNTVVPGTIVQPAPIAAPTTVQP